MLFFSIGGLGPGVLVYKLVPVDEVSNPAKNKRRAFEMSAASISS